MIEGYSIVIKDGPVWERIDLAIQAYQERFGRDPYEIHVDARILPFEMKGIRALHGCLEGQFVLTHEP